MNSISFIRVQKSYFFEYGKRTDFFRVRSPVLPQAQKRRDGFHKLITHFGVI